MASVSAEHYTEGVRLLVMTSIFPNREMPSYAPYTRQQCAALAKRCELDVVATLPWLPGGRLTERWTYWGSNFEGVPTVEQVGGLLVEHARFLRVPGTVPLAAGLYAASIWRKLSARRRPDAILATWAFPDGVAAWVFGHRFRIPTYVQVIGSDINVVAQQRWPGAQLKWALPRAAGVFAVSAPLAARVMELGVPAERVHVVPTGVDKQLFHPRSRSEAREALSLPWDARVILFVGRLHREKGLAELAEAFQGLDPRTHLVVVGEGPFGPDCQRMLSGCAKRVRFTGDQPLEAVRSWITAADVLALPSYREGTPNVVMEALACGRRVVATNVGGIPALVREDAQGKLVPPRDVAALRSALESVLAQAYDPGQVVERSPLLDWSENAQRILDAIGRGVQAAERARLSGSD